MGSIVAGTLLLTATGLFSQVVGFLYRIALSRLIGAETMGLYQLVMPVYSVLLSLTAVGLTVAVSTLSAKHYALGDAAPVVEGAKVAASVVKNGKGKKILVFKYKPKKGYRKRQGHRQPYTKVTIGAISL